MNPVLTEAIHVATDLVRAHPKFHANLDATDAEVIAGNLIRENFPKCWEDLGEDYIATYEPPTPF